MQLARATIESCIATLPDFVDPEDVMYRLYLLGKIEAGETDIRAGKIVTHNVVMEKFSQLFTPTSPQARSTPDQSPAPSPATGQE